MSDMKSYLQMSAASVLMAIRAAIMPIKEIHKKSNQNLQTNQKLH